jgi:hypothetical protein
LRGYSEGIHRFQREDKVRNLTSVWVAKTRVEMTDETADKIKHRPHEPPADKSRRPYLVQLHAKVHNTSWLHFEVSLQLELAAVTIPLEYGLVEWVDWLRSQKDEDAALEEVGLEIDWLSRIRLDGFSFTEITLHR